MIEQKFQIVAVILFPIVRVMKSVVRIVPLVVVRMLDVTTANATAPVIAMMIVVVRLHVDVMDTAVAIRSARRIQLSVRVNLVYVSQILCVDVMEIDGGELICHVYSAHAMSNATVIQFRIVCVTRNAL